MQSLSAFRDFFFDLSAFWAFHLCKNRLTCVRFDDKDFSKNGKVATRLQHEKGFATRLQHA
jgi:hypothetical protein